MPNSNVFDELLREFQEGFAKYGTELFCLNGLTREERDVVDRPSFDDNWGYVGFVPLGDDEPGKCGSAPGYYVYAHLRHIRWARWAERREDRFDRFKYWELNCGMLCGKRRSSPAFRLGYRTP